MENTMMKRNFGFRRISFFIIFFINLYCKALAQPATQAEMGYSFKQLPSVAIEAAGLTIALEVSITEEFTIEADNQDNTEKVYTNLSFDNRNSLNTPKGKAYLRKTTNGILINPGYASSENNNVYASLLISIKSSSNLKNFKQSLLLRDLPTYS